MRFSSSFVYIVLYLGLAAAMTIERYTGKSVRNTDIEDPDDLPSEVESIGAELADKKGLVEAAARVFNNSSSNALSKADGQGLRTAKIIAGAVNNA